MSSPFSFGTPSSTVAAGLALAVLITGCSGAGTEPAVEEEQAGSGASSDAPNGVDQEEQASADQEEIDPMSLAPSDLCEMLPEETLTEVLAPAEDRRTSGGDLGVPDEDGLAELGSISMACMWVSMDVDAQEGNTLWLDLDISTVPRKDDHLAGMTEDEADPAIGVGDMAKSEYQPNEGIARLTVLEGHYEVRVGYQSRDLENAGEPLRTEDELHATTVDIAEKVLAGLD